MTIRERLKCQKMTVEQMRKVRDRVNERLLQMMQNKKAPVGIGAQIITNKRYINTSQSDDSKVKINSENINSGLDQQFNQIPKITLSTTDINYINYLVEKGRISQAKRVLMNLKSTVNIMNILITGTENRLLNKKEK
jgi:hypothetical protein